MKKKLLNNIGIKLVSVLAAMIIWLLIVNVDDAVITETLTLDIVEINAEDLESFGKTYEVVSDTVATIRIKGRPSVLKSVSASDFTATADLSNLSVTGAVPVEVRAKDYVKNVEILPDTNVYKVVTENLVSKQYPVVVRTRGNVATGYYLGEVKSTPNLITITGSETKISNIKEVVVEVDVTGYSSNISRENMIPVVYALNGEAMETDRLRFDVSTVDVSMTMLRTKTVPVKVNFIGDAADGFKVVSKDTGTTEVLIAGLKADLDAVSEIRLECDISDIKEKLETTILYKDFLPQGIYLAEGDLETSGVAVTVNVEPIVDKAIAIPFEDIVLYNMDENCEYRIYGGSETCTVNVSGIVSLLESLTEDDFKVSADVYGLSAGIHSVVLNISSDQDVVIRSPQYMTLTITLIE